MKRLCRWGIICVVFFATTISIIFSVASFRNAFADGEVGLTNENFQVIKQNVLYKAIYSNLKTCYDKMQDDITYLQDGTRWAEFDSEVYFEKEALSSSFLKFPYNIGKDNQSSCPEMITGWKKSKTGNTFLASLVASFVLPGPGTVALAAEVIDAYNNDTYDGVLSLNSAAGVPDESWYYEKEGTDLMANFLKNIGYLKVSEASEYSDYKCFYVHLTPDDNFYKSYDGKTFFAPYPSNGDHTFETQTFCVRTNTDGTIPQESGSIIALVGNAEYGSKDAGHIKGGTNVIYVNFDGTDDPLVPQFRHHNDHWDGKTYLQSNVSDLHMFYHYQSDGVPYENSDHIFVQDISSKSDIESEYCSSHGYIWCGWWDNYGAGSLTWGTHYVASLMDIGGSITYNEFKNRIVNLMKSMRDDTGTESGVPLFSDVEAVEYSPADVIYKKGPYKTAFIKYFLGNTTSGSSNYRSGVLSNAEQYVLYYTYLTERYNTLTTQVSGAGQIEVDWPEKDEAGNFTGNFVKRYIYNPDSANASAKQYILSSSKIWDGSSTGDWEEIARRLGNIDAVTAFADADLVGSILDSELNPVDPETNTASPTCYNSASSLGWILCPVIDFVGGATHLAYDYIEKHFLVVDAGYINNKNTLNAWSMFQGLANIIFVILFIIVIFSQITGIGLDNYGVKKALPKLIIVAVLVNISYIICAVAIDLSNILGDSLKTFFESLATKENFGVDPFNFSDFINGTVSFLITGTAAATAIAFAAASWELWLPLFALFLLGAVISIFFLFIILGVRQAGIILLLVLAPVAVVCYALPNTKSMFERWKKMFVSLLVVYPVCGLLMGGGTFASTLLLSVSGDANGFFFNLVAMLIDIVPFFFIPYLVKSSMATIGNIGTKISNAGLKFRRGATGLARNSDSFKELQNQMRGRNASRFMQRDNFRKNHKILGAPGRAMGAIGSKIRSSNSWLGRLATDMHNQKTTRMANQMISTAALNRKAMNDVRSDYNKRLETAVNAADRSYINDLAKQTQEANANVTEIDELKALHAAALDRFNSDGSSENLAAVEAFQNMMATSDPGRQAMYDNYGAAIAGGRAGGLMRAGQHLVNQHVGNIKSNNRDFWALANAVASGQHFNPSTFTEYTDKEQHKHYHSIDFNGRGIDSYTAADLPKMDIGSLDRLIQHAKEGKLNNLEKARLEEMTREAILSNTIHVQGKVEDRFNDLRSIMGYRKVTNSIRVQRNRKRGKGKKNKTP